MRQWKVIFSEYSLEDTRTSYITSHISFHTCFVYSVVKSESLYFLSFCICIYSHFTCCIQDVLLSNQKCVCHHVLQPVVANVLEGPAASIFRVRNFFLYIFYFWRKWNRNFFFVTWNFRINICGTIETTMKIGKQKWLGFLKKIWA